MQALETHLGRLSLFTAGALCVLSLAACSESSVASAKAPGSPPSFSIAALVPAGGTRWTPGSAACLARGQDPDGTVVVVLKMNDDDQGNPTWTFAPPFACGQTPQCGFVVVTAVALDTAGNEIPGSAAEVPAVGTAISVPLGNVSRQSGSNRLRMDVALWNGTSVRPFTIGDAGASVRTEVTLCAPATDAGADAGLDVVDGAMPPDGAPDSPVESGADAASDADANPSAGLDASRDASAG